MEDGGGAGKQCPSSEIGYFPVLIDTTIVRSRVSSVSRVVGATVADCVWRPPEVTLEGRLSFGYHWITKIRS